MTIPLWIRRRLAVKRLSMFWRYVVTVYLSIKYLLLSLFNNKWTHYILHLAIRQTAKKMYSLRSPTTAAKRHPPSPKGIWTPCPNDVRRPGLDGLRTKFNPSRGAFTGWIPKIIRVWFSTKTKSVLNNKMNSN